MIPPQLPYHSRPGSMPDPYESYMETNPQASPPIPHSTNPGQYPPQGYSHQGGYPSPPLQAVPEPFHPVGGFHGQPPINAPQPSHSPVPVQYYTPPPQSPPIYHPQQLSHSPPPQSPIQLNGYFPNYPPQAQQQPYPQMATQQSIPGSPPQVYVVHEKPAAPSVVYLNSQQPFQAMSTAAPALDTKVTKQPKAKADMVIRGNRNVKEKTFSSLGEREWSNGMFDCCEDNPGTCCLATWCPCIVYGQNKARLEYLSAHDSPDPSGGGPACSGDCALHACLTTVCAFGWALQISSRATVRQRYKVRGDWLGDCFSALCCTPCELAQESREIALEENSFPKGVGLSTGEWYKEPKKADGEKEKKKKDK